MNNNDVARTLVKLAKELTRDQSREATLNPKDRKTVTSSLEGIGKGIQDAGIEMEVVKGFLKEKDATNVLKEWGKWQRELVNLNQKRKELHKKTLAAL